MHSKQPLDHKIQRAREDLPYRERERKIKAFMMMIIMIMIMIIHGVTIGW
jgi:hypothetical protein